MRSRRILEQWRRPEEQTVHDPEHRRVRANAEGKGDDHCGSESRLGSQPANGVTEVLLE
jgi:hypothetical protein